MAFSPISSYKPCLGCRRPIDITPSVSDPTGMGGGHFCPECVRVHEMQLGLRTKEVRPPLPRESRTEPLVGLRVWKLLREKDKLYLRSASQNCVWPHRKALHIDIIANEGVHCIKRDLDKNEETNPYGVSFNMFSSPTTTVEGLFKEYEAAVAGEVYLWGKVIEHEIGYLAEYAYPKRLFMPEDTDVLTWMELEENYGVPVETDARFPSKRTSPEDGTVLTTSMIRSAVQQLKGAAIYPRPSQRQIFQYSTFAGTNP